MSGLLPAEYHTWVVYLRKSNITQNVPDTIKTFFPAMGEPEAIGLPAVAGPQSRGASMDIAWRCTVCSYTHKGEGPPDACPLCGADRIRFVHKNGNPAVFFRDMFASLVLHAAAAHFPNGTVPTMLLFLVLTMATGNRSHEQTVFCLLLVALCMIPVSFVTGFRDWRTTYHGVRVPIFYKKIALAGTLFTLAGAAAVIRFTHPDVLSGRGFLTRLYEGCLFSMLPVVVLLGHYGGKLAYQWKKVKR